MSKGISIELQEKGIRAAEAFLSRKGMEILSIEAFEREASSFTVVANDDERGGLVFVEVGMSRSGEGRFPFLESSEEKRGRLEAIALAFLEGRDEANVGVFFDDIHFVITSNERALVRYHRDCLN